MATKITGTNTAAAPGVTGDDTDTGLFYGTNEIGFSTGGTSRMTLDSNGRLGIGTASAQENLHILSTSGSSRIRMTSADGSDNMIVFGDASDQATGSIKFDHSDNSFALLGYNNAERLRIDSSGRFLKGVTSSEGSRSNTSVRQPHFQLSSPWSSGLGSTSITCTNDYPIIFINSNAGFSDNSGAGVITWSVKDGAGNYCNTASINSQIDGTPGNNDSPGELNFLTTPDGTCQPQTRMTLGSGGDLNILDGNLKVAAGHGIDFSADGNNSGSTSELFDDYEQGLVTATMGNGVTLYSDYDDFTYVKVGNLVTVSGELRVNDANGGSVLKLTNLPWATKSQGTVYPIGATKVYSSALPTGTVSTYCQGSPGNNNLYFGVNKVDGSVADMYATANGYFSFTYTYLSN